MRPLDSASNFDFTAYTLPIYESVLVRFKAADLDQEVKERAISCMGFIICHLGDHLSGNSVTVRFSSKWWRCSKRYKLIVFSHPYIYTIASMMR